MASNFIHRILINAAAEATKLTAPTQGNNIANVSGWFALGSRQRGDDGDLDGDRIELPMADETGVIQPPRAMVPTDYVPMQNGPQPFTIVCYDVSKAVIELASDMVYTGQLGTKTLNTVKRSIIYEINGLCYYYFPNVELSLPNLGAGFFTDGQGKTTLLAKPCEGISLPAGFEIVHYEAA
jgi:hypothetical protein